MGGENDDDDGLWEEAAGDGVYGGAHDGDDEIRNAVCGWSYVWCESRWRRLEEQGSLGAAIAVGFDRRLNRADLGHIGSDGALGAIDLGALHRFRRLESGVFFLERADPFAQLLLTLLVGPHSGAKRRHHRVHFRGRRVKRRLCAFENSKRSMLRDRPIQLPLHRRQTKRLPYSPDVLHEGDAIPSALLPSVSRSPDIDSFGRIRRQAFSPARACNGRRMRFWR